MKRTDINKENEHIKKDTIVRIVERKFRVLEIIKLFKRIAIEIKRCSL